MNRIRFSCFALLAAAAVACNKDDIIMREEAQAPVIAFDVNTGVYTAKVGREFTIAPTYEYVDRAVYAWKLEKTGRIISTEPVLTYVIDEVEGEEKEDYYIELEVTTPQGTTREQTRVEVYRILPPVIVLSEGAEVVRGHVYEISPDVRWGEKATYRWTMRRPGAAEAEEVGREQTYEFCEQALGEYELRLRAENEDGADEKSIRVEVTEALPVSVTVPIWLSLTSRELAAPSLMPLARRAGLVTSRSSPTNSPCKSPQGDMPHVRTQLESGPRTQPRGRKAHQNRRQRENHADCAGRRTGITPADHRLRRPVEPQNA